jgi:hypothetical protein
VGAPGRTELAFFLHDSANCERFFCYAQGEVCYPSPGSSVGTLRKRAASRPGGAPYRRLYSRLNARCWHLIVRRKVNSPATIKYSLSNAAPETSVTKFARMQAQGFWIERAFQDAKSHVGMAQYQACQ